ncbi:MAG: hypothetical protein ACRD0W_05785 [Acidimicrobiales bacterium]
MRLTLESTTKLIEINGVPARVWEGATESGIAVFAFVTRVAVHEDADRSQFEAELEAHRPPRNPDIDAIPNRLVL